MANFAGVVQRLRRRERDRGGPVVRDKVEAIWAQYNGTGTGQFLKAGKG
jgi:hypothetical protein